MRFTDKVAFVTGAGAGFGRAFSQALAAEGAAVAVADIDEGAAAATVELLDAAGHRALALHCDVADEDQVEAAVARTVDEFGGLDVMINNAGKHLMKYNQPFSVLERSELRSLFDVNVIGVVNCSVSARAHMAARGGGAILNISSMAGHMSVSPYSVSKLAVRGLTIALATEFADDNIRVNAISPGLMATENAVADVPKDVFEEFINDKQLVHRGGRVEDIVNGMLYLCSADAGFITGETVKITGGFPLYL